MDTRPASVLSGVVGAALLAAPRAWPAQDDVSRCAVCHGERGKGDGPLNASLKTPAPDLSKIQKNKVGVFPFNRIYRVIDGREVVAAHGPRDMPVWGSGITVNLTTGFRVNPKEPDHRTDRLPL